MADHAVAATEVGKHALTLVAATEDVVTFDRDCPEVEVVSDGADALYVTVGGADAPAATVAGDDTYVLPAGVTSSRRITVRASGDTEVHLISAGTPTYSVMGDF
jgi:uncharacterized protein YjlB